MKTEIKEIKEVRHAYRIESPWEISRMTLERETKEMEVHVICTDASVLRCPKCDQVCSLYDRRPRRWRHLDTGEYRHLPGDRDCPRAVFRLWSSDGIGSLGIGKGPGDVCL